jgi:hypothetical protein
MTLSALVLPKVAMGDQWINAFEIHKEYRSIQWLLVSSADIDFIGFTKEGGLADNLYPS